MPLFSQLVTICSGLSAIAAVIVLTIRPIRERVLGVKQIRDGQKCLLRADMLRTYYKHRETNTIRQYEYENFFMEYKAYKAMGGNGFIQHIFDEVQTWEIVT